MSSNHFRNHLRFALHKESIDIREKVPINRIEKIGNLLSWAAYDFRVVLRKTIGDPRSITVLMTLYAMTLIALFFYPSDALDVLSRTFTWIIDRINWKYVRFFLWIVSEITVFGLGIRAFGRFSNSKLMQYHGLA